MKIPVAPRVVEIKGKLYSTCGVCGEVIRVDKPIIGSLHLCLTDEEVERGRRSRHAP